MSQLRTDLTKTHRQSHNSTSRATIRKVNTNNLAPEASHLDGFHSQTDTDVEIAQGWGVIGVPLDQEEDQQQGKGQQQQSGSGSGELNNNQPKGKAAELMVHRIGSQSHPVAMPIADRRVQPYGMKAGESAHYSMSGTGQMLFHNDKGSYLVVTNNEPEQSKGGGDQPDRFASLRHVEKQKQKREIQEGQGQQQQQQDPKHEGETVNCEVRCTKSRIEFRVGDTVIGYYDKDKSEWAFVGDVLLGDNDKSKMKEVHRKTDVDDAGNEAVGSAKRVWAK